jgi:hypothetical protein
MVDLEIRKCTEKDFIIGLGKFGTALRSILEMLCNAVSSFPGDGFQRLFRGTS